MGESDPIQVNSEHDSDVGGNSVVQALAESVPEGSPSDPMAGNCPAEGALSAE